MTWLGVALVVVVGAFLLVPAIIALALVGAVAFCMLKFVENCIGDDEWGE